MLKKLALIALAALMAACTSGCASMGGCQAFGDLAEGGMAVVSAFGKNSRSTRQSREISRGAGAAAQGLCYVGGQVRMEMAGGPADVGGMRSEVSYHNSSANICSNPQTRDEIAFCRGVVKEQRALEQQQKRYQRERERELERAGRRTVQYGYGR